MPFPRDGKDAPEMDNDLPVLLECKELDHRFKDFCVLTSLPEIDHTCKSMDQDEAKIIFAATHKKLFKYTEKSLDKEYQKQSPAWTEFMEDVELFYCSRFVILGSPMPAMVCLCLFLLLF